MKKLNFLLFAVSIIMLASCSTGAKKDFSSGLSISYDGFSVGEAYLVGPDNKAISSNVVAMNSEVAIVVQGIENYALKDGKAFPGLALSVTDPKGKAVIDELDLFANSEGYSPADAAILRGTVTVGSPMKAGETYHVKMRIWDKNKAENTIDASLDIAVQ